MSFVVRWFRRRWPLLATLLLLLTIYVAYALVGPAIEYCRHSDDHDLRQQLAWSHWQEAITRRTLNAFAAFWFFALGGSFGSYLNVVVWRVPRGMSVAGGGSKCPFCRTPIRKSDNVPVLGWLRLNGRCRACHLPISARYPIVEAIAGTAFLSLALVGLLTGAANLPGVVVDPAQTGIHAVVLDGQWQPLAIFAFHANLLVLLLGAGLILYDGFPLPLSFAAYALIIGIAGPLAYGGLYPLPWKAESVLPGWTVTPLTTAVGLASGILLGAAAHLLTVRWTPDQRAGGVIWAFAILGVYLGWQAALTTSLAAVLLTLASRAIPRFSLPLVLSLFAAAWSQILCWKWLWPW